MFINYQTANLAKGRLKAGISASALSIILDTNQGDLFPSVYPYLLKIEKYDTSSSLELKPVLKREIVKVTNKSGDTFTIERSAGYCPESDTATAQTNTALSFDSGDYVFLVESSEAKEDMANEIARLETDKANDSEVVHNTGDETIDGAKKFSSTPIVPLTAPTNDNEVANKKYVDDEVISSQQTDELIDDSFMAGEAIIAGQCAFLETGPTTAQATTKQNIGDVAGNTRVSFPVIGTGVQSDTFKVNICKTGSTHPASQGLYFRIETDNAGSPSGTLVDSNAIAHILPASLTTSLADTTMTLAGSITIPEGQKCHLVAFQSTSDDYADTVIDTDYYNIGYNTNNTTTRPLSLFNGTIRGNTPGADVNDANGFSYGFSGASTVEFQGYRISAKSLLYIKAINKVAGSGATIATIKSIDGTILATANFVGNTATLASPLFLTTGQNVYVLVGNGGSSYTMQYAGGGQTYPVVGTNINYISGFRTASEDTNAYDIATITTYTSAYIGFPYISSILFQDKLLSLTDSDYAYKIDLVGVAIESKGIGTYPKLTIQGINGEQSGLTTDTDYFLSATPGSISATPGTNIRFIGEGTSDTKIFVRNDYSNIYYGTTETLIDLPTEEQLPQGTQTFTKVKGVIIPEYGLYTNSFDLYGNATAEGRIYVNGVATGTLRSNTAGYVTYAQNFIFNKGDIVELYIRATSNNYAYAKNFFIKYKLGNKPIGYSTFEY